MRVQQTNYTPTFWEEVWDMAKLFLPILAILAFAAYRMHSN